MDPVSISKGMLWRIANAIQENRPVNFDRILGASYNTRSALESLLAHTPQFYWCIPGRIEVIRSSSAIKQGHKHLIWMPGKPHENGVLQAIETQMVVSEMPIQDAVYDELRIPGLDSKGMDIDAERRHVQIQIAFAMIGHHLDYGTWIAQNDRGILYKNEPLANLEGVIPRLNDDTAISTWPDAVNAAKLIDAIWFKGDKDMPAVIEVEHSTGVTSGLSRMKNFQDKAPSFRTKYIVAAPDEDRDKVFREISKEQFASLDAKFMSYTAVEELWVFCSKRKVAGVTDEFIENYLETPAKVS